MEQQAWGPAWGPAWDPAWDPAWGPAWDPVWDLAWDPGDYLYRTNTVPCLVGNIHKLVTDQADTCLIKKWGVQLWNPSIVISKFYVHDICAFISEFAFPLITLPLDFCQASFLGENSNQ